MEVTFINPGVDYMIQSIMHFQAEGEAEFWSEPLYHFYPQLDIRCKFASCRKKRLHSTYHEGRVC